jgi:hypothetical protein
VQINRGDIVKVGRGVSHGEFIAIVDHFNGAKQPYVIPIDGSSISPKFLFDQQVTVIPEDRWTDGQFASYARWRDANGIKPKHPEER